MPSEKKKLPRQARGPYKLYSYKGSSSAIPRRTFYGIRCNAASSSTSSTSPVGKESTQVHPDLDCNPVLTAIWADMNDGPDRQHPSQPTKIDRFPISVPCGASSSKIADNAESEKITKENERLAFSSCGGAFEMPDNAFDMPDERTLDTADNVDQSEQILSMDTDKDDLLPDDSYDDVENLSSEETLGLHVEEPFSDDEVPLQCDDSIHGNNDSDGSDDETLAMAPGLNLSVQEKIKTLLLLATMKRHNLSFTAAETIMKFSNVISDSKSDQPSFHPSRHTLKSVIQNYSCAITEHFLCPLCGLYIGIVTTNNFNCRNCQKVFNTKKSRKKGDMFLYMSLREQLKALLEHCVSDADIIGVNSREKISRFNYEDIFDGKMYNEQVPSGSLSFNFFIDGLQVATTNKKSAWPVMVSLNELKLHLRRKYVLVVCLWLNKKKPNMKEYLKVFIEECNELSTTGITFKRNHVTHTVKVKPLVGISDSIARPMLRNSHQFNGKYGCGLCKHPGIRIPFGNGAVRSYSSRNGTYPLRTHEETMDYARRAELTRATHIKGIKGISIFSSLITFDVVRCLDLDSFHCLVNVGKRFRWLWFGAKFRGRPYNILDRLDEVDNRLMSVTPTCDVSRFPRSLHEHSDYRGHEWYYWIVVYSVPCLKNILPARFFNHWCLLVYAISLLMQNSVTKSEVAYADRFLNQFVSEIDHLYGSAHVTFSVHLLLHLRRSTEDFSQPWTHSAFVYESLNAEIKNMVKSSNGAALQIIKGMQLKLALKKLECDVRPMMTDIEMMYFKEVTMSKKLADPTCVIGAAAFLGDPDFQVLPLDYIQALRRYGVTNFDIAMPQSVYHRCVINDDVYHSTQYMKASKQNNCVAMLENNGIFIIRSFLVLNDSDCFVLGNFIGHNRNNQRRLCNSPLPHIIVVNEHEENILRCIPITLIQSKLLSFSVKISDEEVLRVACVNVLRMEMLS